MQVPQKLAAPGGWRGEEILEYWKLCKRLAQCHKFARSGKSQGDPAREPFEVQDAFQFLADFAANNSLLDEVCDRTEAGLDGLTLDERAKNPRTQKPRAHAGHGGVERGNEGGGATGTDGFFGENGGEQLQIADADRIEHEGIVLLVVADAVEMPQCFNAGSIHVFVCGRRAVPACGVFAQIVNDGAGGSQRLRVIVKAEPREFGNAKLFAQDALGIVALKNPIFEPRFHSANAFEERCLCRFEKLLRPGKQSFPRAQQLEFVAEVVIGAATGEFRGLKFTGGKIDESKTDGRTRGMFGDGREETVFTGVEEGAVGSCTWCDDAHDFTAHEFFAGAGLFHLIANGDLEPGADQPRDIAFGSMVGNAAHGNGLALFAVARGQRDLEFARGDDRVFVEEFVKITQAEEQQGVRIARLNGVILLHQRCGGFAHS